MAQVVLGGSNKWNELDGSPTINVTRAGRTAERKFVITSASDYSAIEEFILECFPLFNPPGQWPVAGVKLYVDSIDPKPKSHLQFDVAGSPLVHSGFPKYEEWEVTVKYSPLPYKPKKEGDPPSPEPLLDNVERTWNIGADAMTLPGTRLYYQGEARPTGDESIASVLRIDTIAHTFTKHHMRPTAIPWEKIRACNNHVNRTSFSGTHALFPNVEAQTLLFRGVQIANRWSSDGQIENTIAFSFQERTAAYDGVKVGWNHLYDATTQTFRRIYRDSSWTKPLYELCDNSDIQAMFQ